jgi:hypothetical protein
MLRGTQEVIFNLGGLAEGSKGLFAAAESKKMCYS